MSGRVHLVVAILLAGWLMAALYAAAASTFGPQALVMLPSWVTALGDLMAGAWLALLIVDLRRTVIAVVASSVVATIAYFGLLVSAAIGAPDYLSNLVNYALPQTVPVLFLCLFFALVGGMVGTAINASARGIEL